MGTRYSIFMKLLELIHYGKKKKNLQGGCQCCVGNSSKGGHSKVSGLMWIFYNMIMVWDYMRLHA